MTNILQQCNISEISDAFPEDFFFKRTYNFSMSGSLTSVAAYSYATLFGAFPVQPWKEIAGVKRVGVSVRSSAALNVDDVAIHTTSSDGLAGVLPHTYDAETDLYWCEIGEHVSGIIYPVIRDSGEPPSIAYVTDVDALAPVRLAVVIPTYRREVQVVRNALAIAGAAGIHPEFGIHIFVIDNGGTLDPASFSHASNISLVSNGNLGGAGGFARGMLEACDDGGFTHIIMCDDDADILPESVLRAAALFSRTSEPIYLGGTMLYQHDRAQIHESGAEVSGPYEFHSFKNGSRVTSRADLARFSVKDDIDYFGWYLVGYPIAAVRQLGLPMPFFIRFDDQEYGLRLISGGYEPVTLLGFCVWHEGFYLRDTQVTHYYLARNGLITLFLRRPHYSGAHFSKQIWKQIYNSLCTLRYDRCEMILNGLADALKGPDFLVATDEEKLNASLMARQNQRIGACAPDAMDGQWFDVQPLKHHRTRKRSVRWTLGGHLLPSILVHSRTCSYINSTDSAEMVYSRKVFFFEPITGLGWIAVRNRARFFRLLLRGLLMAWRVRLQADRVGRRYRKAEQELVGEAMWRKRLGLLEKAAS